MEYQYDLLGIHNQATARVRMVFDDKIVDEDFILPELFPGVSPSLGVYELLLQSDIKKRMNEIRENVIDFVESQVESVDKTQLEQIVEEVSNE